MKQSNMSLLKIFFQASKQKARILKFSFTVFFLLSVTLGNGQNSTLTFVPQWLPQAQFAGYYAALDQGFYEEQGLTVRLSHPSDDESAMKLLKDGKADVISSFLIDGLTKHVLNEAPLINIAQLSQHSSMMFVTKEKSGIDSISELEQKKVAIWSTGFDKLPRALLKDQDVEVEFVPIYNTINLFLEGGVDAMTVMYYNEYDQIINSGVNEEELNTFFFSDFKEFDIPEDGLYCLEDTYLARKEDLKKFVEATLQGWNYVAQNKKYALDLVVDKMNEAHLANNRAHQRWMLNKVLDLLSPKEKDIKKGHLLEADFRQALDILQSNLESDTEPALKFEDFHKPLAD